MLPPSVAIDTASYKVFVSGKSGVGKTALVAKLAGLEVPTAHHETIGIQTTVVFWPAKLQASDRVVMFRFEFWDCGEAALRKFDHMLPACKENTDAFLFLFSFTDRASFEDLPGQLARVAGETPAAARMVIGSKYPLGGPWDCQAVLGGRRAEGSGALALPCHDFFFPCAAGVGVGLWEEGEGGLGGWCRGPRRIP